MALLNFTLDSFGITQTRSKHQDTNFAAFTLKLGSSPPTTIVNPIGNVDNGTHPLQMSFTGVEVGQDDSFIFNYLIVNAGSATTDEVRAALEAVGVAWSSGGGPPAPHLATANGIDTDWLVAQLNGIFRSTCDGIVAAEQDAFSYGELAALMPNNTFSHQTPQPGTHSPSGCGNNSQYTVNWHIATALLMPNVFGMPSDTPSHPVTETTVQYLNNLGFPNVSWEKNTKGPVVVQQAPQPGYVDAGTPVTLWRGTTPP
jgi:hypothetical protein